MVFGKKKEQVKRIDPKRYEVEDEEDEEDFMDDEPDDIEEEPVMVRKPIKKQIRSIRHTVRDNLQGKWVVKEIPIQVQTIVHNTETGEDLGIYEALVELLNRTE